MTQTCNTPIETAAYAAAQCRARGLVSVQDEIARALHEWYLEACTQEGAEHPFNLAAQTPYDELSSGARFVSRYIAAQVLDAARRGRGGFRVLKRP